MGRAAEGAADDARGEPPGWCVEASGGKKRRIGKSRALNIGEALAVADATPAVIPGGEAALRSRLFRVGGIYEFHTERQVASGRKEVCGCPKSKRVSRSKAR